MDSVIRMESRWIYAYRTHTPHLSWMRIHTNVLAGQFCFVEMKYHNILSTCTYTVNINTQQNGYNDVLQCYHKSKYNSIIQFSHFSRSLSLSHSHSHSFTDLSLIPWIYFSIIHLCSDTLSQYIRDVAELTKRTFCCLWWRWTIQCPCASARWYTHFVSVLFIIKLLCVSYFRVHFWS